MNEVLNTKYRRVKKKPFLHMCAILSAIMRVVLLLGGQSILHFR